MGHARRSLAVARAAWEWPDPDLGNLARPHASKTRFLAAHSSLISAPRCLSQILPRNSTPTLKFRSSSTTSATTQHNDDAAAAAATAAAVSDRLIEQGALQGPPVRCESACLRWRPGQARLGNRTHKDGGVGTLACSVEETLPCLESEARESGRADLDLWIGRASPETSLIASFHPSCPIRSSASLHRLAVAIQSLNLSLLPHHYHRRADLLTLAVEVDPLPTLIPPLLRPSCFQVQSASIAPPRTSRAQPFAFADSSKAKGHRTVGTR